MRYKKSTMISLSLILAVLIFLLGIWVYARYYFDFLGGDCSYKIHSELTSQSNVYNAREVVANCGATTDFSTQVIIKNNQTGAEQIVLSLKGDHTKSCNIEWDDDLSLKIGCTEDIETIYNQRKEFEKVKINFYLNGAINEENIII